ncbi:hypothetical protein [Magnetovibrio blakemorei]|uniref:Uncharacterized protein n=1 Tax=Magnetovibrio blakemorei TaxID=28181 RepID=A0A1E5Q4L9_9PROT|nr:hypothetical protein [Magnetovibrio blakemorei]OEJ65202.1 hypothetical protein BEN30_15125 [Magnetovibrio blakemorei]
MTEQDRINLILSQANIAKAAVAAELAQPKDRQSKNLHQALLAIEAILMLADSHVLATSSPQPNAA